MGRRLRAAPPPWKVAGPVSTAATVPTLVITGAWSPLYEEVADALTAAGAARLTLDGHEHRPQDNEASVAVLRAHWAAHDAG